PVAPRIRFSCRRSTRTVTSWPASACRQSRRPLQPRRDGPCAGTVAAKTTGREAKGQHLPFKATKAERVAAGDPRLSLEERYKDHEGYVAAVAMAARKLEQQRLLLPADVQLYVERARASNVLR